jgi:purine nucleosidase
MPIRAGADQAILGGVLDAAHILGPTGIRSRGAGLPDMANTIRPGAVEALAVLLARGVPLRMIDLDACRRVQITEADVEAVRGGQHPQAALLADLLGGYLDIALERGRASMALYDPVATAALLRPDLFTFRPVRLDMELSGRHTRGRTVVETRVVPDSANAAIADDLDAAAVKVLCLAALMEAP